MDVVARQHPASSVDILSIVCQLVQCVMLVYLFTSVFQHCWFSDMKGIGPVKVCHLSPELLLQRKKTLVEARLTWKMAVNTEVEVVYNSNDG